MLRFYFSFTTLAHLFAFCIGFCFHSSMGSMAIVISVIRMNGMFLAYLILFANRDGNRNGFGCSELNLIGRNIQEMHHACASYMYSSGLTIQKGNNTEQGDHLFLTQWCQPFKDRRN